MNANAFDGRMQNLAVYAFNEYKNPACRRSRRSTAPGRRCWS